MRNDGIVSGEGREGGREMRDTKIGNLQHLGKSLNHWPLPDSCMLPTASTLAVRKTDLVFLLVQRSTKLVGLYPQYSFSDNQRNLNFDSYMQHRLCLHLL